MNHRLIFSILYFFFACFLNGNEKVDPVGEFPTTFLQKLEGWPIEWNSSFKKKENSKTFHDVQKALANHLQRITYILDKDKVNELQKLYIRVDLDHALSNMQYHPGKRWLVNNKYDPTLEKRVHVPRARQLLSKDQWAKHPYVILHELAHSYHDKLYERVLLFRGGKTRHYARTNHKEFFAEMTESYLGVNDFYPFVRAELQEHDPQTYLLMQKIWGKI